MATNSFKNGFWFGLGFWAAGVLILFVPFAAMLLAFWQVITKML